MNQVALQTVLIRGLALLLPTQALNTLLWTKGEGIRAFFYTILFQGHSQFAILEKTLPAIDLL